MRVRVAYANSIFVAADSARISPVGARTRPPRVELLSGQIQAPFARETRAESRARCGPQRLLRSRFCVSVLALFRSRQEQAIVELALRQQLAIYVHRHSRPRLSPLDRAFWVALSRLWPRWRSALVVVRPETVIRWQPRSRGTCRRLSSRNPAPALDHLPAKPQGPDRRDGFLRRAYRPLPAALRLVRDRSRATPDPFTST